MIEGFHIMTLKAVKALFWIILILLSLALFNLFSGGA